MNPNRFQKLLALLIIIGANYLVDCYVGRREHPELPWFERGVFALYPFAFPMTVLFFAVGLYFVFRRSP